MCAAQRSLNTILYKILSQLHQRLLKKGYANFKFGEKTHLHFSIMRTNIYYYRIVLFILYHAITNFDYETTDDL